MLDHDLVLKSDELFVVGDSHTDGSGESATGLYARDTRHLSRFRLALNQTPLDRLSARVLEATVATIVEANRAFSLEDATVVLPQTVAVEQRIDLDEALRVAVRIRNFAGRPLPLTLSIQLAADFRDLFDIRGFPRSGRRGRLAEPRVGARAIHLDYVARDGVQAQTRIGFDRPAAVETVGPSPEQGTEAAVLLPGFDRIEEGPRPPVPPSAVASFHFDLDPGDEWRLGVTVTPVPPGDAPISGRTVAVGGRTARATGVRTGNATFDRFYARGESDLDSLRTSFPEGSLPAAGIPWYVAPFGRDSLIVGLQTFHAAPARAASTLRLLASLQGTRNDPERAEEPGKILHEMRYGEMARLGEVPHRPYFGSVDATPLFVLLFAETVSWTGDDLLYRELEPNVRRALEWIERSGDLDGDGFVEYPNRSEGEGHIVHQGWKDSHDSLHHPDGTPARGAIALVEVQGYVYAALARLADVAAARGDGAWAGALRARAEAMRSAVEERFWLEDEGFYAQALDGDKRPVAAISSNPGHLLYCRLASDERGAAVARKFAAGDLDSGWGVRTLSTAMATYNPMSYHNGSVWPHDNGLIAAGLRFYGDRTGADRIGGQLLSVAERVDLARLPELYCGFPRVEGMAADEPVPYPVSCSPQAWAAGVAPLLVRSFLGLRVDHESGKVVVEPSLPDWLPALTAYGMEALGGRGTVEVRRRDGEFVVEVEGSLPWRRA